MKVKKYEAASMPEAMKMIRSELGDEAVILNSKVVHKNGFLGLFRKKNIEVIAAVDSVVQKPKQQVTLTKSTMKEQNRNIAAPLKDENQKPSLEMMNQITELKSIITSLQKNSDELSDHYPLPIKSVSMFLEDQEIDASIRKELITAILEKWYENKQELTTDELKELSHSLLVQKLNALPFGGISYKKKYVSVVGPTGVGKTTTLAKIAAEAILKDGKKVAFITTDTYRIAAIEQLKTYAKILNVPIEVSYNLEDFQKAKDQFSDFDLILIDTAGRNFRNQQYVKDLLEIIDFNEEVETFLVLGLTSKYSDMMTIYKQFSVIDIDRVIFTKTDETEHFGQMVNFMIKNRIGAAYITTGQNVPDDIQTATPEIVVNTLFGVAGNE
ncbi:flagellar biosynthesis protein FlhF [Bacillus sp. PS06]|uniref:flagellar biosynthesis protein FlhF n=1 Tax=Bacillus sp. PS06 TaxID=2764176 RepID=UPI001787601A|nr:flagellar biosynthesis protein FlhF [Bacillus sp. PS06]MBD8068282.1 flagellar biosynthesis protein FlhF [Bacillus sp. PS06]